MNEQKKYPELETLTLKEEKLSITQLADKLRAVMEANDFEAKNKAAQVAKDVEAAEKKMAEEAEAAAEQEKITAVEARVKSIMTRAKEIIGTAGMSGKNLDFFEREGQIDENSTSQNFTNATIRITLKSNGTEDSVRINMSRPSSEIDCILVDSEQSGISYEEHKDGSWRKIPDSDEWRFRGENLLLLEQEMAQIAESLDTYEELLQLLDE